MSAISVKMIRSHIVSRLFTMNFQTFCIPDTNAFLVRHQTNAFSVLNSNSFQFQNLISCKNEGICAGVQLYDQCNFNSECYFGMYCNEAGRCVRHKQTGDRCSSNEACGRTGMCIYETTLSTYGTCKTILSQSANSLILPMYKSDMADSDSGLFVYQNDFEKVCRSGYLNQTSGRCASGLLSTNKRKVCTSDLDCPTSDPAKNAKCKCGHNAKGTKYCDIEGGDDEWADAFAKVSNLLRFK